jgi:hypothetical protein
MEWKDIHARRRFFEHVAKKLNFDPLIPSNWYTLSFSSIKKIKVCNSTKYKEEEVN